MVSCRSGLSPSVDELFGALRAWLRAKLSLVVADLSRVWGYANGIHGSRSIGPLTLALAFIRRGSPASAVVVLSPIGLLAWLCQMVM